MTSLSTKYVLLGLFVGGVAMTLYAVLVVPEVVDPFPLELRTEGFELAVIYALIGGSLAVFSTLAYVYLLYADQERPG